MLRRAVFMGSDPIALPLLDAILATDDLTLVGVFTQPDRQRGRGHKVQRGPIKEWAETQQLPVRQPERCGPEDEAWLKAQAVDVLIVMAYGQILRRSLLSLPALGTWNFHASLLPCLRGASPIATAVAEGRTETGVSLMAIVPQLDAGPVLAVERVVIEPLATTPQVAAAIGQACVPLWQAGWLMIRGGEKPEAQDSARVTYCRILSKADAALDLAQSAVLLHNRVRAFSPWPGSRVSHGEMSIKIGGALLADDRARPSADGRVGQIVTIDGDGCPVVQCGRGRLTLTHLQRPGARMLPAAEFLRGYPLALGDRLRGETMHVLEGPSPFRRAAPVPVVPPLAG